MLQIESCVYFISFSSCLYTSTTRGDREYVVNILRLNLEAFYGVLVASACEGRSKLLIDNEQLMS